jgi:hypothetical protein
MTTPSFTRFSTGVKGGGCDEAEYSDLSRPQLLEMLQRYDKALRKITRKAHDEIALHKYRKESRTGPNEFEKGRLDGYTDTARVAMAALFGGSEYAYALDLVEAVFPWVRWQEAPAPGAAKSAGGRKSGKNRNTGRGGS